MSNEQNVRALHAINRALCMEQTEWVATTGFGSEWTWILRCKVCGTDLATTYAGEDSGAILFKTLCNLDYTEYLKVKQIFETSFAGTAYQPCPERVDYIRTWNQQMAESEVRRQQLLAEREAKIPRCPTCRSTKIRPISTGKRVASTMMFGIASSTIGKSYECLDCKYKW